MGGDGRGLRYGNKKETLHPQHHNEHSLPSKNAIFAINITECLSKFSQHDKGKRKHMMSCKITTRLVKFVATKPLNAEPAHCLTNKALNAETTHCLNLPCLALVVHLAKLKRGSYKQQGIYYD
jgi:hypothetical protein